MTSQQTNIAEAEPVLAAVAEPPEGMKQGAVQVSPTPATRPKARAASVRD
jgi:hypothetical protein